MAKIPNKTTTLKQQKENDARETLLKDYKIKPSSQLLIVIKSVSNSGMSRRMQVLHNNINISHIIADLTGLSFNYDKKGLLVQGCGMDMAFWLADHITYKLWPDKNKREKLSFKGNCATCLDWQTV